MKSVLGALVFGCVIGSAGLALAHTPCCEGKGCPAGQTAVAGATPADAQCCTDVNDPTTCQSAPNAGWACNLDPMAHIQGLADHQVIAGCDQVEQANVCIGGAITSSGPDGCLGLGGLVFVAGSNPMATADDCTNAAVDACCAHDACVVAPTD